MSLDGQQAADQTRWLRGEVGALLGGEVFAGELGPPETWPASLRQTIGVMLAAVFPMFLVWGPRRILIYNDAYRAILGAKHPGALARGFWTVWPEVREIIEPVIEAAFEGRASFFEDLEVWLERDEGPQSSWFTFSYSPVPDGADIPGVLCVRVETTSSRRE